MNCIYQHASLRPHCVVIFKDFSDFRKPTNGLSASSQLNLAKGTAGDYNGYMSPATTRLSKRYINCLLLALKFSGSYARKPTFITLTLPSKQAHDDKFIKRHLFGKFIEAARQRWDVRNYYWRAEPQENGNIHFHILADRKIKWQAIRRVWNYYCRKYGYIDAYRAGQQAWHRHGFRPRPDLARPRKDPDTGEVTTAWPLAAQRKAYQYGLESNWSNPNSTDIHALRKIRNVGAYITKYLTKNSAKLDLAIQLRDQIAGEIDPQIQQQMQQKVQRLESAYRKIDGRIWGASDSLRTLSYFEDLVDACAPGGYTVDGNPEMIGYLDRVSQEKGVKCQQITDIVSVLLLDKPQHYYLKKYEPILYHQYTSYYTNMYQTLYP